VGIYDAREISLLLGVTTETVVRWSNPDNRDLSPLIEPYFKPYFSFEDLVSFAIALHLRRSGISERNLRNGLVVLRHEWQTPRPFANQNVIANIATSGSSFLARTGDEWIDIARGKQGTFESIVRIYLKNISFNQFGIASRWTAASGVILDPTIQAGSPCIEGTRVPTSTILSLLNSESIDEVAQDFDLTDVQVEAARDFELSLVAGNGLRAA
jgi:uncharacterized protein (DUF433 family)